MADGCASSFNANSVALCEEAVLRRISRVNLIVCSAEAICRSSWLICYCMEKCEPVTQTQPTAVTLWPMCAEG